MCWATRKRPVLKIAEEDIKVQKVLQYYGFYGDDAFSPYRPYKWKLGEKRETELGNVNKYYEYNYFSIYEGFHTCGHIYVEDDGFYTTTGARILRKYDKESGRRVFDAIIPKGGLYFRNENDEYVSDSLIITGIASQLSNGQEQ